MALWICCKLFIILIFLLDKSHGKSSPLSTYRNYTNSIELEKNVVDLWWEIDDSESEIIFEYHVKTTGWISLGINPADGMEGADIAVGWIDHQGKLFFQVFIIIFIY